MIYSHVLYFERMLVIARIINYKMKNVHRSVSIFLLFYIIKQIGNYSPVFKVIGPPIKTRVASLCNFKIL